jgi:hypothetical protein
MDNSKHVGVIYGQPQLNSPLIWRDHDIAVDECCHADNLEGIDFSKFGIPTNEWFQCKKCKKVWHYEGDKLVTDSECQNWSHYDKESWLHVNDDCFLWKQMP